MENGDPDPQRRVRVVVSGEQKRGLLVLIPCRLANAVNSSGHEVSSGGTLPSAVLGATSRHLVWGAQAGATRWLPLLCPTRFLHGELEERSDGPEVTLNIKECVWTDTGVFQRLIVVIKTFLQQRWRIEESSDISWQSRDFSIQKWFHCLMIF